MLFAQGRKPEIIRPPEFLETAPMRRSPHLAARISGQRARQDRPKRGHHPNAAPRCNAILAMFRYIPSSPRTTGDSNGLLCSEHENVFDVRPGLAFAPRPIRGTGIHG